MAVDRDNVALIGMPGAGKTTLGVLLAKRTAREFIDTDLEIQDAEGATLQELIATRGVESFRGIEERCVAALDCSRSVIATGGSVVYCEAAMKHLTGLARVVYLDVPLAELERRVGDVETRGLVRAPGQSLASLFAERRPRYERWAEIRVDCTGLAHDEAVEAVLTVLRS